MTIQECIKKHGIITDCDIANSRWGIYEVQFNNQGEKYEADEGCLILQAEE